MKINYQDKTEDGTLKLSKKRATDKHAKAALWVPIYGGTEWTKSVTQSKIQQRKDGSVRQRRNATIPLITGVKLCANNTRIDRALLPINYNRL